MRKFIIVAFLLSGIIANAQEKVLIHDANAEARSVPGFSAIEVQGGIDIYLSQGSQEAVAVSASRPEYRDKIRSEVKNGVLHLWYEDKSWFGPENRKLKAYVTVATLNKIRASGASDVYVSGTLKATDLELQMSGASDFKGKVSCSNLKIDNSGASDLDISGDAQTAKIELSGASDFKGYEFTTEYCDVHATGASDVKITVNKELSAHASGASDVYYRGNAVIKNVNASGASSVKRRS
ncbi:MAG: hypothetical protein JWN76_645 [Chitinophagaceae bacterium]|nr:hypothetical protein [Chitinophagaceae bacterium]